MNQEQKNVFQNDYMPYIIKWGKITCWLSIPLIFIPTLALIVFFGAEITLSQVLSAFIPLFASMLAWYIVDPITLFPILHVPGMYMTYIAGNSKEIRGPAASAAMSAANVESGTEHGTVVSCIAIAVSVFVSIICMTVVALAGNFILSILPAAVISALNYLLPALYGSLCVQKAMLDPKTFFILVPFTILCCVMNQFGIFRMLPLGGGYAQILIMVVIGALVAKNVHGREKQEV